MLKIILLCLDFRFHVVPSYCILSGNGSPISFGSFPRNFSQYSLVCTFVLSLMHINTDTLSFIIKQYITKYFQKHWDVPALYFRSLYSYYNNDPAQIQGCSWALQWSESFPCHFLILIDERFFYILTNSCLYSSISALLLSLWTNQNI